MKKPLLAPLVLLDSFGRSALRQPIYTFLFFIPPFLGLLIRPLYRLSLRYFPGFNFDTWIPLFLAVTACFPPYLFGLLAALMLLDERDCGLLPALRVTPVSDRALLYARIVPASILSFAGVPLALFLSGQATKIPAWSPLMLGLIAAPTGAFYTLFIASVSQSKVQALSFGKILGTALIAPVLLVLLPSPWRFGTLVFPTSWMGAPLIGLRGGPLWILGGLLYALILARLSWKMALKRYFA